MIAEEPRIDATKVTELAQALEAELARLIVGQKELVRDTVIAGPGQDGARAFARPGAVDELCPGAVHA